MDRPDPDPDVDARLATLRAELHELTEHVVRLQAALTGQTVVPALQPVEAEPVSADSRHVPAPGGSPSRTSRRRALQLAGATAAGVAAAATVGRTSAANDTLVIGADNAAGGVTRLDGGLEVRARPGDMAAVRGVSTSTQPGASAGVRATSARGPALLLDATHTTVPTIGTWSAGALVPDLGGNLWWCVEGGTPGRWVNLVTTGGTSFTPLSPGRVYDSRAGSAAGPLKTGYRRTVRVADLLDPLTYAVVTTDHLPAGAVAITANITVVDTVGSGFLAINPFGDDAVHAATINWFASGQIFNNGVNLLLGGDRQLAVIAGGSAGSSTSFVIDVTGYYR